MYVKLKSFTTWYHTCEIAACLAPTFASESLVCFARTTLLWVLCLVLQVRSEINDIGCIELHMFHERIFIVVTSSRLSEEHGKNTEQAHLKTLVRHTVSAPRMCLLCGNKDRFRPCRGQVIWRRMVLTTAQATDILPLKRVKKCFGSVTHKLGRCDVDKALGIFDPLRYFTH